MKPDPVADPVPAIDTCPDQGLVPHPVPDPVPRPVPVTHPCPFAVILWKKVLKL
jgi:hypothetical protein